MSLGTQAFAGYTAPPARGFAYGQAQVLFFALAISLALHLLFLGASPWIRVQSVEEWRKDKAERFNIQVRPVEPLPFDPGSTSQTQTQPEVPPAPDVRPDAPTDVLPGTMLEFPRDPAEPAELPQAVLDVLPPAPRSEVEAPLPVIEIEKTMLDPGLGSTDRILIAKAPEFGEGILISGTAAPSGPPPQEIPPVREVLPPSLPLPEAPIEDNAIALLMTVPSVETDPTELLEPSLDLIPGASLRDGIQFESLDEHLRVQLFTYHLPEDPLGYFGAFVSVRTGSTMPRLPKEFVFVVDSSKSISPIKLPKLKQGVEEGLRKVLSPNDLFNVVAFSNRERRFRGASVPATQENIRRAIRFVRTLESAGETDIYSALFPLVSEPPRLGVPYILLLSTDGNPTTGETNPQEIINRLTEANRARASIYSFGGGQRVNHYLLNLLSYQNWGDSRFSAALHEIDDDFVYFAEELQDPILTRVRVSVGSVDSQEIYPKAFSDLFRGKRLAVYGRFRTGDRLLIRLAGEAGGRLHEYIHEATFPGEDSGDESIPRLWAFHKANFLMGEICREGENPTHLAALDELQRRYGVTTVYNNTDE